MNNGKLLRPTILLLFVLSGFCGLVYEVAWVRMLMTVFGVGAYAVSIVLASFMGGLALGSFLFGRFVDRHPRPLLIYGILEIGIGLYALAIPTMFRGADALLHSLYAGLGEAGLLIALSRFTISFLLLVIPTILMGATVPILSKFFIRTVSRVGRETGRLYFLNTFGAVAGCALAGFLLIPTLGLRSTVLIPAILNIALGILVIVLSMAVGRSAPVPEPTLPTTQTALPVQHRKTRLLTGMLIAGYAISGFCALVFEVLWSRILILLFGSTVYSFSAMLSVFLFGLALGGIIFARIADRSKNPKQLFAGLLAGTGVILLLEIAFLNTLPFCFLWALHYVGIAGTTLTLVKFLLSAIILLPATLLFGGTFPVASKIYATKLSETGRKIGTLYAVNTFGAILGSLAGGFIILPVLGTRTGLIFIASALFLAGLFFHIALQTGRTARRWVVPAVGAVLFAVAIPSLPSWNQSVFSAGIWFDPKSYLSADGRIDLESVPKQTSTLYFAEGINDTIIVRETPTERILSVNGKIVATSSWEDILHLKMLGHLPALLHPGEPRTALNVGLGIGGTVSALVSHPLDRVDVAELEPKVVAATRFFADVNENVMDNPRLRVLVVDGRNYLSLQAGLYDIISSDPFQPYMTGAGNLYSREYFSLVREHLTPDGMMAQWLPLHQLSTGNFRSILATFADVFPDYTVWFGGRCVILIGSLQDQRFDPEKIRMRILQSADREEIESLGMDSPESLLSFLLADADSLAPWLEGATLNTDDFPFVEYDSANRIFEKTTGINLKALSSHYLAPEKFTALLLDSGAGIDEADMIKQIQSKRLGLQGIIALYQEQTGTALNALTEAISGTRDPFLTDWLAETHEQIGHLAQQQGALDVAIQHFDKARLLQPTRVASLANLGYLLYRRGDFALAVSFLQAAYELAPRYPEIGMRLALALDASGDPASAEVLYHEAAEAAPDSFGVQSVYALFRMRLGDYRSAETLFRRAMNIEPKHIAVRESLADALLQQNKLDEAVEICSPVLLEAGPPSFSCNLTLGVAKRISAQHREALDFLLRAAGLQPGQPEPHYQLALLYANLGRDQDMKRELQEAIRLGGEAYLRKSREFTGE